MAEQKKEIDPSQSCACAPDLHALLPSPLRLEDPRRSEDAHARRLLLRMTRYAMLFCVIVIALCLSAVPVLGAVRVQQITCDGNAYYLAEELIAYADVSVGDQLFAVDPARLAAHLTEQCPYLRNVRVERMREGRVHITVTERQAVYAVLMEDGRFALMDETFRVLDITESEALADSVCRVAMTLFVPSEEEGEEWEDTPNVEQSITVGTDYDGNPPILQLLMELADAMAQGGLLGAGVQMDLRNPYAVTITLSDGSLLFLHACQDPHSQVRAAATAWQAYRETTGQRGAVQIDVDDLSRVSLRPLSQNP